MPGRNASLSNPRHQVSRLSADVSAISTSGSDTHLFDRDLHGTWSAACDEGRHDENLRMVESLLETCPDDPDLHLLHAMSLLALDRYEDEAVAVHRAIDLGQEDATVLTRAASLCFYGGDLPTARK